MNKHFKALEPQEYLGNRLSKGERDDGRKASDFRPISLQTGIITSADGSALVRCGDSIVLTTIKGEIIDEKVIEKNKTGNVSSVGSQVIVNVEGQPYFKESAIEDLKVVANVIQNLMDSACLVDLECLDLSGETKKIAYWCLHVDISVLSYDGSPLSSCLLAVGVALKTATLPFARLIADNADERIDESTSLATTAFGDLTLSENICAPNFTLTVNKDQRIPLRCVNHSIPVAATFLIIGPDDFNLEFKTKYPNGCIVCDPTNDEQSIFPNNTLTLVLRGSDGGTTTKRPVQFLLKKAGSQSLNHETLTFCQERIEAWSRDIDRLVADVLS